MEISPKGTVPVFVYKDIVLDESIDIMNWAMEQKNNNFIKINPHDLVVIKSMIKINDGDFKNKLDLYKYTSNKEISLKTKYRKECEIYIKNIDENVLELLQSDIGDDVRTRAVGRGLVIGVVEGLTGGAWVNGVTEVVPKPNK